MTHLIWTYEGMLCSTVSTRSASSSAAGMWSSSDRLVSALGTDRTPTRAEMAQRVRAWNRRANHRQTVITWRFTRKHARGKLRYDPRTFKRGKPWLAGF